MDGTDNAALLALIPTLYSTTMGNRGRARGIHLQLTEDAGAGVTTYQRRGEDDKALSGQPYHKLQSRKRLVVAFSSRAPRA
jgi:hypothetical protein